MLPAKISECPVGCHRGKHVLHFSALLTRSIIRRDTNQGPIKLVKLRVFETTGTSDEQHDFTSAVPWCIISAGCLADT